MNFSAKKGSCLMNARGEFVISFVVANKKDKSTVRSFFDKPDDFEYDISVTKHRKRRSLDANGYCWVLINQLAAALNIGEIECYQKYIRECGVSDIIPIKEDAIEFFKLSWERGRLGNIAEDLGECRNLSGYHYVKVYHGSSVYNTEQMARLLDLIIQDCEAVGIKTETPDQIREKISLWEKHYEKNKVNNE